MTHEARRILLVLGMHRSGTSAVSGTAVRLGGAAPATMIAAQPDNPTGFYESAPVILMNDAVMRAADCSWDLCLHKETALITAAGTRFHAEMARLMAQEFPAGSLAVMKDPRLCLTAPAWLPVLGAGDATLSALLVCRHPLEVMQSLTARDRMSPDAACALWLHYMLEAEAASRRLSRAVIFFDDLLTDWRHALLRAGRMAGIGWGKPSVEACAAVDAYLADALRHHRSADQAAAWPDDDLTPMLRTAWEVFAGLRDDPFQPSLLRALVHLRAAFSTWRARHYPPTLKIRWQQAA
jgi:hypothetical protein